MKNKAVALAVAGKVKCCTPSQRTDLVVEPCGARTSTACTQALAVAAGTVTAFSPVTRRNKSCIRFLLDWAAERTTQSSTPAKLMPLMETVNQASFTTEHILTQKTCLECRWPKSPKQLDLREH